MMHFCLELFSLSFHPTGLEATQAKVGSIWFICQLFALILGDKQMSDVLRCFLST